MPDGTTERISATQFALQHDNLISLGATFDFSEFNKVIGGKRGPLFNKLKKAVDKFGNKKRIYTNSKSTRSCTSYL